MLSGEVSDNFRVKSIEDIKSELRKHKKIREINSKKKVFSLLILVCVGLLCFLCMLLMRKSLSLSVANVQIGVVESKEQLDKISNKLKQQLIKETGALDVKFNEKIKVKKVKYDKTAISNEEKVLENLKKNMTYSIKAYVLKVNGTEVASFQNKAHLNRVINVIKAKYSDNKDNIDFVSNPDKLKEYFFGNIELTNKFVQMNMILSDDEIINILEAPREKKVYEVKKNDTLFMISEKTGVPMQELLLANDGFTENQVLNAGQKINLSLDVAVLPVVSYKEQSYETVVEPTVDRIIRDDKYEDYVNIMEPGKEGKKKVNIKVKVLNGKEISKDVVSESEIVTAQKKVIEVGSMKLPNNALKGLFMNPTRGIVTSYFGEQRGGYTHEGLDIANSIGTGIYSAYVGEVVFAGVKNGYGNVIIIKHSSGYETLYAHLNKILVEKGTKVERGMLIAEMGSTGNSTGSHLHFEVHKDGALKNPLDYVEY